MKNSKLHVGTLNNKYDEDKNTMLKQIMRIKNSHVNTSLIILLLLLFASTIRSALSFCYPQPCNMRLGQCLPKSIPVTDFLYFDLFIYIYLSHSIVNIPLKAVTIVSECKGLNK